MVEPNPHSDPLREYTHSADDICDTSYTIGRVVALLQTHNLLCFVFLETFSEQIMNRIGFKQKLDVYQLLSCYRVTEVSTRSESVVHTSQQIDRNENSCTAQNSSRTTSNHTTYFMGCTIALIRSSITSITQTPATHCSPNIGTSTLRSFIA